MLTKIGKTILSLVSFCILYMVFGFIFGWIYTMVWVFGLGLGISFIGAMLPTILAVICSFVLTKKMFAKDEA